MAGYIIAQIDVTDPDKFKDYSSKVSPTIEAFGGEFVVRGGEMEVLEGDWALPRCVVIKFPSVEQAKAWHESDVYKPLLEMRLSSANANLVVVEGT